MYRKAIMFVTLLFFAAAAHSLTSADLEKDLRYYERTSASKGLNENDRLYILLKIRDKYNQSGVDLSWIDAEVDRLGRLKAAGEKKADAPVHKELPAEAIQIAPKKEAPEFGVSDIEAVKKDGKILIIVTVNNPGRIKHFPLIDAKGRYNPKVVVDIEKAVENVGFRKKDFNPDFPEIKRVRIGQFQEKPEPVSRVIIEMDKARKYTVSQTKTDVTILIDSDKDAPAEKAKAPPAPAVKQKPPEVPAPPALTVKDIDAAYKLGTGDIIRVNVEPSKELSVEQEVDDKGFINMKLIDKVRVEGLTEKEASELIREKISKFIKNPSVSARITKFGAQKVYVLGYTNLPVESEYTSGYNIYDFIRKNGGFKPSADLSGIFLNRGRPGKRSKITVNLGELIRQGQENEIPVLEPGDIIEVAQIKSGASIIGEVERPGRYEIQKEGISILKLLAMADGHTKNAYLRRVVIIKNGKKIFFNLANALKSRSKRDVTVQPGDIVYIPGRK